MRPLLLLLLLLSSAAAEPLPFSRAIELALKNARLARIADAEQSRARQGFLQQRNLYYPQLVVGSGLGYSFGFPLSMEGSAPSLVNVNSQQFLYNAAQRDFVRAAERAWSAATFQKEDRRQDVILQTATAYTELTAQGATLKLLQSQAEAAARVEAIARERFAAGIDRQTDVTRAQLAAARLRLRIAVAEGTVAALRLRLSQLTGQPAESIETVSESVPALPPPPQAPEELASRAESNPQVKAAAEQAAAKELEARGQSKWRYPAVDLVGQYALLSRHNNYEEYYRRFQRHNGTVGLAIRFPFLNFAAGAQAEAAAAEAVGARQRAEAAKDEVATEIQRLQSQVRQLAAARDVARLEHQLARADAEAAQVRADAGQIGLPEQQSARLSEQQAYTAFLDAEFDLTRAHLQFLRVTGQIEAWAANGR